MRSFSNSQNIFICLFTWFAWKIVVKKEIWRLWLKRGWWLLGLQQVHGGDWVGWNGGEGCRRWLWLVAVLMVEKDCAHGWVLVKTREKRLPTETSCSWDSDGVFLSTTLWGTRTGFRIDWVWFFWVSLARNRLLISVSCRREKVPVLDYFMRAVLRLVEMEEWNWVLMTFEGNERWSLCVVDLSCGVGGYWVGWFAWRLVVLWNWIFPVLGRDGILSLAACLGEMKFEFGNSAGIEDEDGGWWLTRVKEMSLISGFLVWIREALCSSWRLCFLGKGCRWWWFDFLGSDELNGLLICWDGFRESSPWFRSFFWV